MKRFLCLLSSLFFSYVMANDTLLHFPKKVEMVFSGPYNISATMSFQQNTKNYEILTNVNMPFKPIRFISKGTITQGKLQPDSYHDWRKGKLYAHSIFDYTNQIINYGRDVPAGAVPMIGLPQDFFTLAWQMSLHKGNITDQIQLTNGKKVFLRPPFQRGKNRTLSINSKATTIFLYISGQDNERIELGLMPDHFYIPALIIFYDDSGTRYELTLKHFLIQ